MSKLASEGIVRRYGGLFGIAASCVRLSGVFGPMERSTLGRAGMSMPYHMMRSVIEKRPFRVTAGTLDAGGDFLSAGDVGSAMSLILRRGRWLNSCAATTNGSWPTRAPRCPPIAGRASPPA